MQSPFAGMPLDYLIGLDMWPGQPGHVTELGYDATKAPKAGEYIQYGNLRDEKNTGLFVPYRSIRDDIDKQYGEPAPEPGGKGFLRNVMDQIARVIEREASTIEWDNLDTYDVATALGVFDLTHDYALGVAVKNPALVKGDAKALIAHPACEIVVVERGAGGPSAMHELRDDAGRPDMPVRFVFYADGSRDGDARLAAQEWTRQAAEFSDMGVTFSRRDEYGHSEHLLLPRMT